MVDKSVVHYYTNWLRYRDKIKQHPNYNSPAARRRWRRDNPVVYLIHGARQRAKKIGVECTITSDDLTLPDVCPVFGIKLECGDGAQIDTSPSIDRIDNTKGYVPGNVRILSWKANNIRRNFSLEDLEAVVAFLKQQQ